MFKYSEVSQGNYINYVSFVFFFFYSCLLNKSFVFMFPHKCEKPHSYQPVREDEYFILGGCLLSHAYTSLKARRCSDIPAKAAVTLKHHWEQQRCQVTHDQRFWEISEDHADGLPSVFQNLQFFLVVLRVQKVCHFASSHQLITKSSIVRNHFSQQPLVILQQCQRFTITRPR